MPFAATSAMATLRANFERAVVAEIERVGPAGLRRHEVVTQWRHAGASRTTLWRWLQEMLDHPAGAGPDFTRSQKTAGVQATPSVEIVERNYPEIQEGDPPLLMKEPAVQVEIVNRSARFPPSAFSGISGAGAFQVVKNLQDCIAASTRVMADAQRAPNDFQKRAPGASGERGTTAMHVDSDPTP
jgi:hypothetical protein